MREHLAAAARTVGATIVGEAYHQFSPRGVTAVVLIAESHFSTHTWPTRGYVAVDAFTCGGLNQGPACDYLGEALAAETTRFIAALPKEGQAPLEPGLCEESVAFGDGQFQLRLQSVTFPDHRS